MVKQLHQYKFIIKIKIHDFVNVAMPLEPYFLPLYPLYFPLLYINQIIDIRP